MNTPEQQQPNLADMMTEAIWVTRPDVRFAISQEQLHSRVETFLFGLSQADWECDLVKDAQCRS